MTHVDIAFVVSIVSQFLNSLHQDHCVAVIRILNIKMPLEKGLLYEDKINTQIVWYFDTDWARSPSNRNPVVFLLEVI